MMDRKNEIMAWAYDLADQDPQPDDREERTYIAMWHLVYRIIELEDEVRDLKKKELEAADEDM